METLPSIVIYRVTNIYMSENINKNEVEKRFKIIYVIGMLSVITGHCCGKSSIELILINNNVDNDINGWFHYRSFHMSLFMFVAGYFYKIKNDNSLNLY